MSASGSMANNNQLLFPPRKGPKTKKKFHGDPKHTAEERARVLRLRERLESARQTEQWKNPAPKDEE